VHTGPGPSGEFVGDGGWAVPARRRALPEGMRFPNPPAGEPWILEVDPADLAATLRAVAADPAERAARGGAARRGAAELT
jgi:hypothetical protein